MIDKKYIELMNKEIDRVITPGEKQELHNYLSVNEAARNYYDGLLSAVDYAENLADFNPPENLKKRIMNSIDFSLYESKTRSKKTLSFLWGLKFKYAYTFAAGLLAAILIYTFFTLNSGKVNNDEIYGTIGAAGNIKTIQEIQLNFSDISGKIELKESENNFWFVISADTPQETRN